MRHNDHRSNGIAKVQALSLPVELEVILVSGERRRRIVDKGILPASSIDEEDEATAIMAAENVGPLGITAGLARMAVSGDLNMGELQRWVMQLLPDERLSIMHGLRSTV